MPNVTTPSTAPFPDPPSDAELAAFSQALVAWQKKCGRHDLPWQQSKDAYRVWLSEIMLQQTQVVTVKDYYQRFLSQLPTVEALANAPSEQVMALWAGLGYYSRARNLHKCAQQVMSDWQGEFPRTAKELETLSGIGPSTAAAIASTCFQERVAILDGNVKRVLARWLGLDADIGDAASVRWLAKVAQQLADSVGSQRDMPVFTQGLMDLGATVCKPKQPECDRCPMMSNCRALATGRQLELPVKRRRVKRQTQRWWLAFVCNQQGEWAWGQRPARGIWSGLHTPLIFEEEAVLRDWLAEYARDCDHWPMVKHVLTHRDLFLYPVVAQLKPKACPPLGAVQWLAPDDAEALGMPAPIVKLWRQVSR